jgi:phosphinothricin acetyltransferase
VLEEADAVLGFAYAMPWKARAGYDRTVETSIYLHSSARSRGLGVRLYGALLERLSTTDLHAVLAGIALPNPASIALYERLGFVEIGRLREVGWKRERWVDVGYWQKVLTLR